MTLVSYLFLFLLYVNVIKLIVQTYEIFSLSDKKLKRKVTKTVTPLKSFII